MLLQLSRPIAFIEVQSTGLDPRTARIVRLSVLKITPDGDRRSRSVLVNPGASIPPGASAVHGVTDDDVAEAPSFAAYGRALAEHLEDCDIAGFGVGRFGLPLLEAEFRRAGVDFSSSGRVVIDAMAIFHKKEPRDLRAAFRRFAGGELPEQATGEELVEASLAILSGELEAYDDLPRDVPGLDAFLNPAAENAVDLDGRFVWSDDGDVLLDFGRHRGRRLADVVAETPDYLEWVAARPDFSDEVRRIARDAIRGEFPTRTV